MPERCCRIPDRPAPGLTTYDAKDPDTTFAPIEPLLPPPGSPNVLIVLLDDVGYESGTTVTDDYTARSSRFTGKIQWVQIDLDDDDNDHFIDPDERLRVAMARQ